MVAEHTWGVDIKSYLRDETAWDRPAFEAARANDYRFKYSEASWDEQRTYLDDAVAALEPADRALAEAPDAEPVEGSGWLVETDPITGDVALIRSPAGKELRGEGGSLLGYRYESYDAADIAAHMDTYLTHRAVWAILDHAKPGLERAATARSSVYSLDGDLKLDATAHAELGAPARVEYRFRALDEHRIEITVTLVDKPANRMPEASFVTFTPAGRRDWQFLKMGQWLAANRVAHKGGGQLQAVAAVRAEGIELQAARQHAGGAGRHQVHAVQPPAAGFLRRPQVQPPQQQVGHEFPDVVGRRAVLGPLRADAVARPPAATSLLSVRPAAGSAGRARRRGCRRNRARRPRRWPARP